MTGDRYGRFRLAGLTAALALTFIASGSAPAAAKKKVPPEYARIEIPEVPDDDIFGFTAPTGLGDAGELGLASEYDGRPRKRDGSYSAVSAKYELGYTLSDTWWIGGSAFGSRHRIRDVTGLDDVSTTAFDGLSLEIAHRLVTRSVTNPVAVTLAAEPRWATRDGTSGLRADAYGVDFKFFTDAVVVPERIFWAANLTWMPQRAQDAGDRSIWLKTSSTVASTAVTFQLSPQLFVGAEARHLASFDRGWIGDRLGYAVYVGPTLLWKIASKIAVNLTWQPQVGGHSVAGPDLRYDLDNYERAQFRAKLSVGLN